MGLISILFRDPIFFAMLVPVLLISLVLHEISHGWTAYFFGDRTAKDSGRLSLNPIAHIDPFGALAIFLVGFGWAKPVPIDYYRLSRSRLALISVSLSGCFMNFMIAFGAIFILYVSHYRGNGYFVQTLSILAKINIILCVFNLLPIPPLDGSRVVMTLLPDNAKLTYAKVEPYGFLILILLILTGVLWPVILLGQRVILGIIMLLMGIGS